jgi:hypothetical protein
MAGAHDDSVAWGLELGGSCVRLARVERTRTGYRLAELRQQPLDDRWTAPVPAENVIGGRSNCLTSLTTSAATLTGV